MLPIGLLLSGWAAQKHISWVATDVGIALIGDAFTLHAASALAAVSFLRSLAGFGFPLFAPAMYNALGYGKGNTILAVVTIVLGCPAPWLLWRYGKRIRLASRYAST